MARGDDDPEFASYLEQLNNGACIAHGISIGANLKIFDIMASLGKPATCQEIADAGRFKERYVREWLALMVVGKVIEYDAKDKTYLIPSKRIQYLTEKGKDKNMAVFIGGIPVVTKAFKELEACFNLDGPRGTPYSSYPDFQEWKAALVPLKYQWSYIERVLKHVPGLFEKLEKGITVCDAGSGCGFQIMSIAERYPNSDFLGFDIDAAIVEHANEQVKARGLKNMNFVVQDACKMPSDWMNRFDLVTTWDVVHDVPYSLEFVKAIEGIIKPSGLFFMNDVKGHENLEDNLKARMAPRLYGFSLFHCMPVSLYFENGEGLGTMWGVEKQHRYLQEAGFENIKMLQLENDLNFQSYFIATKKC